MRRAAAEQTSPTPLSDSRAMASGEEGDSRRWSTGGKCLFKGRGRATLTVFGYQNWQDFLKCNDRELTSEEIARVEMAADYENFSVEGVIGVEWPDIRLEFKMDRFLGERRLRAIVSRCRYTCRANTRTVTVTTDNRLYYTLTYI